MRFFVTAVPIQRETGGNLAEILDNLADVVRERFKLLRQVRVHTAHGRFTGYVLLALPAALGVALSFISPEHMKRCFQSRMGRTMLGRRRGDADRRLLLDPPGHQDRGVMWSCCFSAPRVRLRHAADHGRRHGASPGRRRADRAAARRDWRQPQTVGRGAATRRCWSIRSSGSASVAPRSPSEMGKLQRRLVAAGYRCSEALHRLLRHPRRAARCSLFVLFAMPLIVPAEPGHGARRRGLGYILPGMVLGRRAKQRQHRIRLSLPDALDLLVVSVEAGSVSIRRSSASARNSRCASRSVAMNCGWSISNCGPARRASEALHNLGAAGPASTMSMSLVAMLVQTDKFGTSVAQSLRVHSETLRTKRRQRAEEAAAKTGVKMVFPLVFCIFPAIWVVTIGPAAIKFIEVLLPLGQQKMTVDHHAAVAVSTPTPRRRCHGRSRTRDCRSIRSNSCSIKTLYTGELTGTASPSGCACRTRSSSR